MVIELDASDSYICSHSEYRVGEELDGEVKADGIMREGSTRGGHGGERSMFFLFV